MAIRRYRKLEDVDAIIILKAIADFKSKHGGRSPTYRIVALLFDSVKDSLLSKLTVDQLRNKVQALKEKYIRAVNVGVGPTPFDRTFFDLSVKAWGERRPIEGPPIEGPGNSKEEEGKNKKRKAEENGDGVGVENHDDDEDESSDDDEDESNDEEEEEKKNKKQRVEEIGNGVGLDNNHDDNDDEDESDEDGDGVEGDEDEEYAAICGSFKYLTDELRKQWEEKGYSMATLKILLKDMDKSGAAALEKKWKDHYLADLVVKAHSFEAKNKLMDALVGRLKGENS